MRVTPYHLIAFAVLAITVLLMAPAGSPLQITYVTSGSMEPSVSEGDGLLILPGSSPGTGDVMMFWSEGRGEYVVHRVVGIDDGGYITQGDANDGTDQDAGFPPVPPDDVVGVVLSFNGAPVVIPGLEVGVTFITENVAFILGGLAFIGALLFARGEDRGRRVLRVRDIVLPVMVAGFLVMTVVIMATANTHTVTYAVLPEGSEAAGALVVGESYEEVLHVVGTGNPLITDVYDARGWEIVDTELDGREAVLTMSVPPSEVTGSTTKVLHVTHYPRVLPRGGIEALHGISPVLAATLCAASLMAPFVLLYVVLLDGRVPLRLPRRRRAPLGGGGCA